jgi:hypothetical protein
LQRSSLLFLTLLLPLLPLLLLLLQGGAAARPRGDSACGQHVVES